MKQRLQDLGCPPSKLHIQRIGVDTTSLPFAVRSFSDGLRIALVGRFVEKKGLVDGLRACGLARSLGTKLTVTIVGDASPNDSGGQQIKEELLSLANCPELSNSVRFGGFLPLEQTRSLLQTHNVFLCPSKVATTGDAEGGSPVALTEAMAFGLVCVGTRHCDIPEVVIDGRSGYLCDEGDVVAMADILCAIGSDPGRVAEITEAGREHVEENFSLVTQLNKMRVRYESSLARPSQSLLDWNDDAPGHASGRSHLAE